MLPLSIELFGALFAGAPALAAAPPPLDVPPDVLVAAPVAAEEPAGRTLLADAWALRHLSGGVTIFMAGDGDEGLILPLGTVSFGLRLPLVRIGRETALAVEAEVLGAGFASSSSDGGGTGLLEFGLPVALSFGHGLNQVAGGLQRWGVAVGGGATPMLAVTPAAPGAVPPRVAPFAMLRGGFALRTPKVFGGRRIPPLQAVEVMLRYEVPMEVDGIMVQEMSLLVHLQSHFPR